MGLGALFLEILESLWKRLSVPTLFCLRVAREFWVTVEGSRWTVLEAFSSCQNQYSSGTKENHSLGVIGGVVCCCFEASYFCLYAALCK